MKIFMAAMGLNIGGAETHITELARELCLRGHEVVIASQGGVFVEEVERMGARHYQVPMHRRTLGCMLRSRAMLRRLLEQERPDVIHAHARIPAFLCGTLHNKFNLPLVTTCHGVFQVSGALKLLSNWGEHTIAVSQDIQDYLMQEYALPASQITLSVNGIDTQRFSPERSGAQVRQSLGIGEETVICHVSRLDAASVHTAQSLIELAPQLDRAIPGCRVLIVGDGDMFETLKTQAEACNRSLGRECLILTGPHTDVWDLLAAGDLFVGVSRAALEAMAEEKPVILSGAQGHTGLFTPPLLEKAASTNFCCRTDPVASNEVLLASILSALALPEQERQSLGAFGRKLVMEDYSVRKMAEDCLAVYQRLRRPRFRVVMSGYYGFSNAGDDAILEAVQQAIHEASDEVGVTVLSNDPDLTRRQYGLAAIPRFRIWKVFSALRRSDLLLSGGGSLLQDTTSTRSLFYYLSVIRCAQWLGKPVMLYANGIGPVRKPANRRSVRRVVERADLVTLRDHSSARELAEMAVHRTDIHVTADPVFHLTPASPQRGQGLLLQAGLPAGAPFVAVSIRDWPGTGDFPEQLARMCDHLRTRYGLEILFLLMQPSRDRENTKRVRQAMAGPSYLLDMPCTPRELMAVLGQARLCLAMRLHTLIFAARMAVVSMGLVYDPKVESYLQELSLPSAGHVEHFDGDEAIVRVDSLMEEYDQILARLQKKSAQLAAAAGENERLLLELLERTRR